MCVTFVSRIVQIASTWHNRCSVNSWGMNEFLAWNQLPVSFGDSFFVSLDFSCSTFLGKEASSSSDVSSMTKAAKGRFGLFLPCLSWSLPPPAVYQSIPSPQTITKHYSNNNNVYSCASYLNPYKNHLCRNLYYSYYTNEELEVQEVWQLAWGCRVLSGGARLELISVWPLSPERYTFGRTFSLSRWHIPVNLVLNALLTESMPSISHSWWI